MLSPDDPIGSLKTSELNQMFPRWFTPGVMATTVAISTVALSTPLSVSAQDSFLDEFRSVNHSQSHQESVRRPEFLSSPMSDSAFDSQDDEDTGDRDGGTDVRFDEHHSRLHSAGLEVDALCAEPDFDEALECDTPLVRSRDTCYQGGQLNYGYIHDDPSSGLAIRTMDTYATFAIPLGSMDHVITLTPFFRADMLDAAMVLDVPETLYETGVKGFWRRPVNDRFTTMLLLTPSVRSDFRTTENAFRLFGMALLSWQAVPGKLAVSGGAMYTGRQDFPVLPAMGLLWTPAPQWRLDVQFPSPRLSYRIAKDGATSETWAYLSGVFGGNTWAVTRASGAADMLTISDLRLVSGMEHLLSGNRGIFAEIGYVFSRSLEYTDVPVTHDLDSTWMLRTGISF